MEITITKGESLMYDFGYGEVAARRWINADGRSGGIVADSAMVADSAIIGDGASIGPGASIGEGAVIGDGAIIGGEATISYRASIGASAIIGADARIGAYAHIGAYARIGAYAAIGYRASIGPEAIIGDDADIEAADWYTSGGPCGSRGAVWTAVHSREHGLRWWVGCQRGISTEELLAAVQETHSNNEHAQAYRRAVRDVTTHPTYLRRIAQEEISE